LGFQRSAREMTLGCRFFLLSERCWERFQCDSPHTANVIPDCCFQFRQNRFQFILSRGSNSPVSEEANAVFKIRRHRVLRTCHVTLRRGNTAFLVRESGRALSLMVDVRQRVRVLKSSQCAMEGKQQGWKRCQQASAEQDPEKAN